MHFNSERLAIEEAVMIEMLFLTGNKTTLFVKNEVFAELVQQEDSIPIHPLNLLSLRTSYLFLPLFSS